MADQIQREVIVNVPVSHAFEAWSDFGTFPAFMKNIKSVTRLDDRRSHWVMEGPMGKTLEWDAETTRVEPDKRIAWNSLDGGDIKTSGQVLFNPLPNGQTAISVTLKYVTPAGKLGEVVAALFDDPQKRLGEDLRNFKAYVEGKPAPTKA